jgi:hypothetical protein
MANRIDGEVGPGDAPKPTKIDKNLEGEQELKERATRLLKLFNEILTKREKVGREIHVANKTLAQHYKDYFAAGEDYPEVKGYIDILERIVEQQMDVLEDLEKQLQELTEYSEELLKKIETESE